MGKLLVAERYFDPVFCYYYYYYSISLLVSFSFFASLFELLLVYRFIFRDLDHFIIWHEQ